MFPVRTINSNAIPKKRCQDDGIPSFTVSTVMNSKGCLGRLVELAFVFRVSPSSNHVSLVPMRWEHMFDRFVYSARFWVGWLKTFGMIANRFRTQLAMLEGHESLLRNKLMTLELPQVNLQRDGRVKLLGTTHVVFQGVRCVFRQLPLRKKVLLDE